MVITDYKKWLNDLGLDKNDKEEYQGCDFQEIVEIYVALRDKKSRPKYEIEFVKGKDDWITIQSKYNKDIKVLRLSPRSLNAILCEMRTRYTGGKDIEEEGDFREILERSKNW